jgi:hypothetical protein
MSLKFSLSIVISNDWESVFASVWLCYHGSIQSVLQISSNLGDLTCKWNIFLSMIFFCENPIYFVAHHM